jgi:hypothetical protein
VSGASGAGDTDGATVDVAGTDVLRPTTSAVSIPGPTPKPRRPRFSASSRFARGRPSLARSAPSLLGLLTGLLVLGPALTRGYLLRVDMVAVPDPPLKGALLGFSTAAPRAVPSDLVLTLLSQLLPADLAQKVLLLGVFVVGGAGIGALLKSYPLPARLAAVLFFLWNPYVAERLLIGHWALLYGYVSMPWIAWAAGRVRGVRDRPTWRRMMLALLPAALGGFAAMIVAGVVVAGVSLVRRSRRTVVMGAAAWLLWSTPWLLPSLANAGTLTGDPAGAGAFAARADTPFGAFGSLLMLGGIWNRESVPDHYADAPLLAVRAVLTLAALAGVGYQLSRPGGPGRRAVAVLVPAAVLGLALASIAVIRPGLALLRSAIHSWPALGTFRDAQQFVAPLALLEAVGLGAAVAALLAAPRLRGQGALGYAVTALLLPVLALPQLAWGVTGTLQPARYPADWAAVGRILDGDPSPGALLLLPWSTYRVYAWNPSAPVFDPATKAFARRVVADDALVVGQTAVRGEDALAVRAATLLAADGGRISAADCRSLGVRYVLVEEQDHPEAAVSGLVVAFAGPDLTLYRVPD